MKSQKTNSFSNQVIFEISKQGIFEIFNNRFIIETKNRITKNVLCCNDCNRSFLDRNFSNHLRSQGHIVNLMKKRCNSVIPRYKLYCNNHDLTCCMYRMRAYKQTFQINNIVLGNNLINTKVSILILC